MKASEVKIPNCKNCWDKGFSTEYVGESIAHADFGDEFGGPQTKVVANARIVKHYCTCALGKRLERMDKRRQSNQS